MTKNHKRILSNLHAADIFLREAMVLAGTMVARDGYSAMKLVTNEIRDSEWHLDEALAYTEAHAKAVAKKSEKRI